MLDAEVRCPEGSCLNNDEHTHLDGQTSLRVKIKNSSMKVEKCICEWNQSGRRVVFYPQPVAMSTTLRCVECLLHREHVVIVKDGAKVISRSVSANSSQKSSQFPPEQIVQTDSEWESIVLYHSLIIKWKAK